MAMNFGKFGEIHFRGYGNTAQKLREINAFSTDSQLLAVFTKYFSNESKFHVFLHCATEEEENRSFSSHVSTFMRSTHEFLNQLTLTWHVKV